TRTMWIRGEQGLWSVNASRTQVESHGVVDGLPDDHVGALLRASDGTLWVGAANGVAHRVSDAWQVWDGATLSVGEVRSLFQDRSGRIWAGGEIGLAVYDGGAWTSYRNTTIGFSPVLQTLQDRVGRMWFCARNALGTWNGQSWRTLPEGSLASPDNF